LIGPAGEGGPISSSRDAGKPSKSSHKKRYIAKYKGVEYFFETKEEVEDFFHQVKVEQADIPKRNRAQIKLTLAPEFKEEVTEKVTIPERMDKMPQTAAMAFVRKIEMELAQKPKKTEDAEEDEILSWLL